MAALRKANLVVSPSASLRPSAERRPAVRAAFCGPTEVGPFRDAVVWSGEVVGSSRGSGRGGESAGREGTIPTKLTSIRMPSGPVEGDCDL